MHCELKKNRKLTQIWKLGDDLGWLEMSWNGEMSKNEWVWIVEMLGFGEENEKFWCLNRKGFEGSVIFV